MTKLYTPELLGLSASLAEYPFTGDYDAIGEARSRSCGSSVEIGLDLGPDQRVSNVGIRVKACAVGQSAAAIFARQAVGQTLGSIEQALPAIEAWLGDGNQLPQWPGFEALAPALDHKGRHDALKLPWRAGISALCSLESPS